MWKQRLEESLPVFGHRNWIVVADAAFPTSSRPGIETIHALDDMVPTLTSVLSEIDGSRHIRAEAMFASELLALPESVAEPLRSEVLALAAPHRPHFASHEDILSELAEHAASYRILMIKTHAFVPFTSAFLKLECGYWDG